MKYRILNDKLFDLALLPDTHKEIYAKVQQKAEQVKDFPSYARFANFWLEEIKKLNIAPRLAVVSPIYKICQDIDSRLMIRLKLAKGPDEEVALSGEER